MAVYALTHPTKSLARGIEDLVICAERSSLPGKIACHSLARLVSLVVFPFFLTLELVCKRIPKMLLAIGTEKLPKRADKALTYLFSIIPSIIFALHSPEGMPGFVLKRRNSPLEIRPFGVEELFGKSLKKSIAYPKTEEEVRDLVLAAKEAKTQVSVIGAGMSQGTQTIPEKNAACVIHAKHLNKVQVNVEENTVTAGAGATWEEVQLELDKVGKSIIVKQASDPFSVGGTIGINAHGWAHQFGAIAKVTRSLKMIDANGELKELFPPRPNVPWEELTDDEKLFKCMFGTHGYFGIVVEATFDIVDNEELIEKMEEVDRDQFLEVYETKIKDQENIPLFGGRLVLDSVDGDPMRTVCMVSYEKTGKGLQDRQITPEPSRGTRIERIGLKLISHLSNFSVHRLISKFWKKEKTAMASGRVLTRNEALHPPINAFNLLHHSNLHAEWLQEYFLNEGELANFLRFLGAELRANDVRMINSTIRPTPQDDISILPYADEDRHAVVICFAQRKTPSEIQKTKQWIENVNAYLVSGKRGVFYQAYMPWATREQFEACYGEENVQRLRECKAYFDPDHVYGNAHTAKYYDEQEVV